MEENKVAQKKMQSVVYRAIKKVLVEDGWPNYYLTPKELRGISRRLVTQIAKLSRTAIHPHPIPLK